MTLGYIDCTPYIVPSYCCDCGKPYPWTQLQLEAISELVEFDDQLSNEDKHYINTNISSITTETPKTKVVATKLNAFLRKAGSATTSAIRDILVDIASESAKKIIFPE